MDGWREGGMDGSMDGCVSMPKPCMYVSKYRCIHVSMCVCVYVHGD